MNISLNNVHSFFNNTDNYLFSDSTILLRKSIVFEILGDISSARFLDIGCGNGLISKPYLELNHITFLDLSEEMLKKAKENIPAEIFKNAEFFNSSIEDYESNKNFDIVLLLGVLAHVSDIESVISKVTKLTRGNGLCIVQITNYSNFIAKVLRLYSKFRQLFIKSKFEYSSNITRKVGIIQLFDKYGFSCISQKIYFPTFPGFRFIKREIRTKILFYLYKHRIFSKMGSEIILVFKNQAN